MLITYISSKRPNKSASDVQSHYCEWSLLAYGAYSVEPRVFVPMQVFMWFRGFHRAWVVYLTAVAMSFYITSFADRAMIF